METKGAVTGRVRCNNSNNDGQDKKKNQIFDRSKCPIITFSIDRADHKDFLRRHATLQHCITYGVEGARITARGCSLTPVESIW